MKSNPNDTQVVILVGGKGTRLGHLTKFIPKPLLEVKGEPFLHHLLKNFLRYGYRKFILLAGHHSEKIEQYASESSLSDCNITVLIEPEPMGTGGSLKFSEEFLDDEFILSNGDSIFNFNIPLLYDDFMLNNTIGHIALKKIINKENRYGEVVFEEKSNIIDSFREKEKSNTSYSYINAGVYFFKKTLLNYIDSIPCSLEEDVLPVLAKKRLLSGKKFNGNFIDIGTPESYELIQNKDYKI